MTRDQQILNALKLAQGRIQLLASIVDESKIDHGSDHPGATNYVLQKVEDAIAQYVS